MRSKFLFSLGLVFTIMVSPVFAGDFNVKELDSMDMNIIHNTSNTGCIGEEKGPYNGDELGGNYSYIKCNNGPADMTGAIKDGYGEKLSDQTFTIRISYTGHYEEEGEDGESNEVECPHVTNIQLPYATRNLPQFTENLINDHVNCSNNCTVDQSEIDDVFEKINGLLTNQDTGYYNKTVIGDWYIYQGNHEYPGVNKKISDLSKNRRLFVPAGDDLWLVNFDSSEFDLYSEYYTGKSLLGNTAMKYSAGPVYSNGRGNTNTLPSGEVFYIGEEENTNRYFRVVNTFLVCKDHIKCRTEGCDKNVASSGVTAGNFEKYVSHHCEDHACGFCWMTANATSTYSYSSLYSYERLKCLGSNKVYNNEPWMLGLDNENIDLRYLAWEGIAGIASAMTPDTIEYWIETLGEDIYPHEFCATHRCDLCEKPIIGRNTGDARFEEPEVYQGRFREMYSNYCEEHFCEHFLCNKPRVTSESSEPMFNFLTGRRTGYNAYCKDHSDDCGIVIVHVNSDGSLSFYEKGCFVYDDAYTLYNRPVCLEDIISRYTFTKDGDRYIYSIARKANGKINHVETQERCQICNTENILLTYTNSYINPETNNANNRDALCSTCIEFQPNYKLNMVDRKLLTDIEVKKLKAYNPMKKVIELKQYRDFIWWVDSEGNMVQSPNPGISTSSSILYKWCVTCQSHTLWHNISSSMRICSRCYCDESGNIPDTVIYE